jgi:hypothetical protein
MCLSPSSAQVTGSSLYSEDIKNGKYNKNKTEAVFDSPRQVLMEIYL